MGKSTISMAIFNSFCRFTRGYTSDMEDIGMGQKRNEITDWGITFFILWQAWAFVPWAVMNHGLGAPIMASLVTCRFFSPKKYANPMYIYINIHTYIYIYIYMCIYIYILLVRTCYKSHDIASYHQYPITFPCELPLTSTFLAISITPMIGGSELSHRLQLSLEEFYPATMA